jgi:acyl-CoA synthetase (AMP-forming)/AMP-acid ligase II
MGYGESMPTELPTDRIRVTREWEVRADPNLLHALWSGSQTFALASNHLHPGEHWMDESLARIPTEYRHGHFVLLTSGSTGEPKLVVASKNRAERLVEIIHVAQDNDRVRETIACLPLSYSYAFINQWVWSHHMRRRFILTEGFSRSDELRKTLEAAEDAMVCLVGIQVPLLLSLFGSRQFPGIIRINFAGGQFPQEQLSKLLLVFPKAEVFNNYGCAEAMPRLTIRRARDAESSANIGRPLPGVELRSGEEDQLEFRSPFRAVASIECGIFRAVADEEWVATGDLAQCAEDGSWVLLGRKSEVFKRFGEKISLSALHSAVQRVWSGELAFYREHDSAGENGHVMVVAPHPPVDQLRSILLQLRHGFTRPHWPLRVESMEQLPRLPNNKVDTCALAQRNHVTIQWSQRS